MNNRVSESVDSLFRYPNTLPPVLYVGRHHSTVGIPAGMRPHCHPRGVEICCVLHGNIEWWTDDTVQELRPTDVFVTLPRVPHGAVDSTVAPCDYLWVHLDPCLLPEVLATALTAPGFAGLHRAEPEMGKLVAAIYKEHSGRDPFSVESCRSLVGVLIASLARSAGKVSAAQLSTLVVRAQQELFNVDNPAESVAEVADRLFVSEAWLTKKFREEVGMTPAAWSMSRKMARAKRLLRMTEDSVGEIAAQLDFASSQYFATAFRRITGRTPSEYRRLDPTRSVSNA